MHADNKTILPGWQHAYEIVWALLPVSREHITPARSSITPASILRSAELAGLPIQYNVIPRWEEHDRGLGLYTKLELFNRMFANNPIPPGPLILIAEVCFPMTAHEPFLCLGGTLREFIIASPLFIFDGDVVFLWPEDRHISVFDHEGGFAHLQIVPLCHESTR